MSEKKKENKYKLEDMPHLDEIQSALKVIEKTCLSVLSESDCEQGCPLYSRKNDCCGMELDLRYEGINELNKPQLHRFFE